MEMNPLRLILTILLAAVTLPARAILISYSEDAAGRLTAVNYNGTSRTAFGYDKNGSLLSRISTVTPALAPPPSLAATYNGLVTNAAPTSGNVGTITLKMLANGTFTGKVVIAGTGYAFAGAFSATGTTTPIVISRKAPLTNYTLGIALDVVGGTQQITGSLTDSIFTSAVAMDPVLYNTTTNLVPGGLVGKYTALFTPTQNLASIPQGDGYATISIASTGAVTLAGKLANNVAISQSSTLVGTGSWPLFVALNANMGYIAGLVSFDSIPGVSDFAGSVAWEKPMNTGTFHPAAFATQLSLIGSRYDVPVAGQRALNFLGTVPNAAFLASGGNLALPVGRSITLNTANTFITPVDVVALKLTLTTATGLFTGSFKDGAATRLLGGVLFQEGDYGGGFFVGSTLSGLLGINSLP